MDDKRIIGFGCALSRVMLGIEQIVIWEWSADCEKVINFPE
jgi:hypothetical protein